MLRSFVDTQYVTQKACPVGHTQVPFLFAMAYMPIGNVPGVLAEIVFADLLPPVTGHAK